MNYYKKERRPIGRLLCYAFFLFSIVFCFLSLLTYLLLQLQPLEQEVSKKEPEINVSATAFLMVCI